MTESIGKILKEARAQKGLAIEQVSQLTHIKIRFLEAMENDQMDLIPSIVQAKGFIRLYCDLLGIASQPLLTILAGNNLPPEPLEAAPPPTQTPEIIKSAIQNKILNPAQDIIKRKPLLITSTPPETIPNPQSQPSANGPESSVIFNEIGQMVRQRRESLGLSLQDIEEYIHVRTVYLQQIEEGKINELPSTVQARGMLNNVLSFLDLDAENVMLRFAEGLQSLYAEKTIGQKNAVKKSKQARVIPTGWRRFFSTDLLVGSTVILAILGFVIWGAIQLSSLPDNQVIPGGSSISDVLMETLPATTGTVQGNNSKLSPGIQNAATQPGGDTLSIEPTATTIFTGSGPIQVNLVSNQRTYLRVIVDGKTVFDGRVLPGNAYPYSGSDQIEVLTGNAAAIKLSYQLNGTQKDMGILGSIGEVKSLIFTNQGVTTPTPRYTASPSVTVMPSTTITVTPTPEKATITPYIPQ